jgi:hypothetical protein
MIAPVPKIVSMTKTLTECQALAGSDEGRAWSQKKATKLVA